MEVDSGFVRVGDADLHDEIAGDGPPVVLVHAGVADRRQWNHEFAWLAAEFRVLRYDLRGHGKSIPVEGEFRHMADLVALLDQRGFTQPIVLIGCSIGGRLALDFALAHPARVKALVLVGAGVSGFEAEFPEDPREAEAEAAFDAGRLDRAAELEAQIWFDGVGRSAEQVDQTMRALALDMNRQALSHAATSLGKRLADAETPAVERLGELKVPLLVVIGAHDLPYFHAAADHIVERAPSARKVMFDDAAHLANMDQPERFQRVVRSFLAEVG